jgi:hypothetical protein
MKENQVYNDSPASHSNTHHSRGNPILVENHISWGSLLGHSTSYFWFCFDFFHRHLCFTCNLESTSHKEYSMPHAYVLPRPHYQVILYEQIYCSCRLLESLEAESGPGCTDIEIHWKANASEKSLIILQTRHLSMNITIIIEPLCIWGPTHLGANPIDKVTGSIIGLNLTT